MPKLRYAEANKIKESVGKFENELDDVTNKKKQRDQTKRGLDVDLSINDSYSMDLISRNNIEVSDLTSNDIDEANKFLGDNNVDIGLKQSDINNFKESINNSNPKIKIYKVDKKIDLEDKRTLDDFEFNAYYSKKYHDAYGKYEEAFKDYSNSLKNLKKHYLNQNDCLHDVQRTRSVFESFVQARASKLRYIQDIKKSPIFDEDGKITLPEEEVKKVLPEKDRNEYSRLQEEYNKAVEAFEKIEEKETEKLLENLSNQKKNLESAKNNVDKLTQREPGQPLPKLYQSGLEDYRKKCDAIHALTDKVDQIKYPAPIKESNNKRPKRQPRTVEEVRQDKMARHARDYQKFEKKLWIVKLFSFKEKAKLDKKCDDLINKYGFTDLQVDINKCGDKLTPGKLRGFIKNAKPTAESQQLIKETVQKNNWGKDKKLFSAYNDFKTKVQSETNDKKLNETKTENVSQSDKMKEFLADAGVNTEDFQRVGGIVPPDIQNSISLGENQKQGNEHVIENVNDNSMKN